MKTYKIFLCSLLLLVPILGLAQDGTFDTTFGGSGFVLTGIDDNNDYSNDVIQQTDGKLLVTGSTSGSGGSNSVILRYLINGELDTSFGGNGVVISNGFDPSTEASLQNSGKILLSGNSNGSYLVQRFTSSGELDTTFADNGSLIPINKASKIKILNNDNFLLVGATTNGSEYFIVLQKYLINGAPDTTFGNNGVSIIEVPFESISVKDFKIQNDNSVILLSTGAKTEISEIILMKFLSNGSIDSSFGTNGSIFHDIDIGSIQNSSYAAFDIAQNGNIVIATTAGGCQSAFKRNLLRFLPNGVLDETFGSGGIIILSGVGAIPFKLIIQENNRILIGEDVLDCFEWSYLSVKRLFENGEIDSTLSLSNSGQEPSGSEFILQTDGKIVAVGATPWFSEDQDFYIGRYNNNPLGIEENDLKEISIFPNPSEGLFILKSNTDFDSESTYVVTDISGKIIQKCVLQNSETIIDLSEAQNGMYFLKTTNNVIRLLKY